MELKKIEIGNYKSITESVCIDFYKSLPTVLIGKNGSGKSNILEALEHIASANSYINGKNSADGLRYTVHICLGKDEFKKLFPREKYTEEKATFTAYASSNNSLRLDTIESKSIVPLLKKEFEDIRTVTKELRKAIEEYESALGEIECDDNDDISLRCYAIVDGKNNTTNYGFLKDRLDSFIKNVDSIYDSFSNGINGDNTFVFSNPDFYFGTVFRHHRELIPFKLCYREPELANFEQKYISVDEAAIKQEIEDINKKTEASLKKINELFDKLKTQAKRLMDSELGGKTDGEITIFLRKVCRIFGEKCEYLLSENSQVFFKDMRKENNNRYYDPSRVVFEAYAKAKKKHKLLEDKERKLTADELKEFEEWLNGNRPTFDEGMYKRVTVSLDEKNRPIIELEENNGQKVSLNETSAGRRWYFTYYFVKSTLSKGDTFVIDEPASMLHPSAQREILQELLSLSEKGIRVVYSTHSPYLIPEDWNCVGFVSMEDGTKVIDVDVNSDEFRQFRAFSSTDIFGYQEIVEYYNKSKFKSKITESICGKLVEKYPKHSKIVKALKIEERTFYYWQEGKKTISVNNIIKAAFLLNVDALTLIKQSEN